MTATVGLATCADFPELDDEGRLLVAALTDLGVRAVPAVWDDPAQRWDSYDLVVVRDTWDYVSRRDEFVAWAESVPRLANPADVLRWNTDKRYLTDLAVDGVPVVPTLWLEPGDPVELPDAGEYVVKPAVSAGAKDTARYRREDGPHARAHIAELHAAGRVVMVQPYISRVDTAGETALLYIGGAYSHCIRKGPLLAGPDRQVEGLFREETIEPRTPQPAERTLAERVLDAVPGGRDALLYARVDLLPGAGGSPLLLELELTEPSMFLGFADGAARRFAEAIVARTGG